MSVVKFLLSQGIKIKYSINKRVGMEIHPSTVDDHRKPTCFLDTKREECCTCRHPENKTLRVVLRGIPLAVDVPDIQADLREKGFSISKICRFNKKDADGREADIPLMLVGLPRNEVNKETYNIQET